MLDLFRTSPYKLNKKDGVYFHPSGNYDSVLALTATTDFSSQAEYQISTQPTVDTQTVTDAITRQPRKVSISGVVVPNVISGFANPFSGGDTMRVSDFVSTVNRWREQKLVISLTLPEDLSLIQCFITGFEASRDKTNTSGLDVKLDFTEILSFPQQVGKAQATVKEGSGKTNTSASTLTTSKESVTSKVEKGQQATTDNVSMSDCRERATFANNHADALKDDDFYNAYTACGNASKSYATKEQKVSANSAMKASVTKYGVNHNKVSGNSGR